MDVCAYLLEEKKEVKISHTETTEHYMLKTMLAIKAWAHANEVLLKV